MEENRGMVKDAEYLFRRGIGQGVIEAGHQEKEDHARAIDG